MDNYIKTNRTVLDTKGKELVNIDDARRTAIVELKKFIQEFQNGKANIYEFKTNIDSYNKRNNLWGFTATKGQMFFNQLVKNSEANIEVLTTLLKQSISLPKSLDEALSKIGTLEKHCQKINNKVKDKRKVPNPGSVSYFLSYFWQIQDETQYPILYTSLINAYIELDIWKDTANQVDAYQYFYALNEEIKDILKTYTGKEKNNWDAEHAFWNF